MSEESQRKQDHPNAPPSASNPSKVSSESCRNKSLRHCFVASLLRLRPTSLSPHPSTTPHPIPCAPARSQVATHPQKSLNAQSAPNSNASVAGNSTHR